MHDRQHPDAEPNGSPASRLLPLAILVVVGVVSGCGKDATVAGQQFAAQGDFKSAAIEYKNAVQDNPRALDIRLALAEALEKTHDIVAAEQHLRQAIELGGDSDQLVPRVALIMLETGNYEKLASEFKDRQLAAPSADSDLRAVVALAQLALHRPAQAEQQIKASAITTPMVSLAKGQSLLMAGKVAPAVAELQGGLAAAKPGDRNRWWLSRALSRSHDAMGNSVAALAAIKEASEAVPWNIGVLGEYGKALAEAGDIAGATSVRDQLKKVAPNYHWTHYLDAYLLADKGQIDASHAAGLKVLALAPEHLRANLLVASAELQRNMPAMAEERMVKMLKSSPYSLPAMQLLATAQLRLGRPNDAAAVIEKALRAAPGNQNLLKLKADVDILRGATADAMATMADIVKRYPNDADSMLRLALLNKQAGKPAVASDLFAKAADLGKDDPSIRDRIIALALRNGNPALAQRLSDHAMQSRPQDPRSLLTVAAVVETRRDLVAARRAALAALDLSPEFQPALNALTSFTRTDEQRQELLARYEKAVAGSPQDPFTFLAHADLLRQTGRPDGEIVAALEKGIAKLPNSVSIREALVLEQLAAGKKDAAIGVAQAGAAAVGAPAAATALLAATYDRTGAAAQAIEAYRKLTAEYPQVLEWRLRLADLEVAGGDVPAAKKRLHAVVADFPTEPAAYARLAGLSARDNPAEALSIARQLTARASTKAAGLMLESELLVESGKPDDAIRQLDAAAKAGAGVDARLATVRLLDRLKRIESADKEMAEVLQSNKDKPAVLAFAARRALAQGKRDQAIDLFQRVIRLRPDDAVAINDLAWTRLEAKRPDALATAVAANRLSPNHPAILDTLAMAQLQSGKAAEAIAALRKASNLAPSDPDIRLHLGEALTGVGERKEAAQILEAIPAGSLNAQQKAALQAAIAKAKG